LAPTNTSFKPENLSIIQLKDVLNYSIQMGICSGTESSMSQSAKMDTYTIKELKMTCDYYHKTHAQSKTPGVTIVVKTNQPVHGCTKPEIDLADVHIDNDFVLGNYNHS